MKLCTGCSTEKDLSNFSFSKVTADGKKYTCKTCVNAYNKAYRERNREKLRDYRKDNCSKSNNYNILS